MVPQVAWQMPTYGRAIDWLEPLVERYIGEIINICEIPAPTFAEEARADWVADRFVAVGLADVHVDSIGNVLGRFGPARPGGPTMVVSAHLDTVFPAETDVTVRRQDGRLWAPGISDNSASVAGLIYTAWALQAVAYRPGCELWFVANVGEEGLGDLRGMKYLLQSGLGQQQPVSACIVFDGTLGMICHRAIGSRRLRITFRGLGGHSWGNFGRASAIHVMGHVIAAIDKLELPRQPRTTLNVGLVDGGSAVNVIAEKAGFVIDLRSEDAATLLQLEQEIRELCRQTTAAHGKKMNLRVVGDRPAGGIDSTHPLVGIAAAAAAHNNIATFKPAASTDANIPLAMGIPAVCIGIKRGRGAHTLDECLDIQSLMPGLRFGLLSVMGADTWLGSEAQRPDPWRPAASIVG